MGPTEPDEPFRRYQREKPLATIYRNPDEERVEMRQRISADEDSGRSSRVTVGSLLVELEDYGQIDIEASAQSETGGRGQGRDGPQEVLTAVTNALFPGAGPRFDEDLIKRPC